MDKSWGVPPQYAADAALVWDGRCFALLSTLDSLSRLHHRCRQTVPEGALFCATYHSTDRNRGIGTIWCHRPTCAQCPKSGSAHSEQQNLRADRPVVEYAPDDIAPSRSAAQSSRRSSVARALATTGAPSGSGHFSSSSGGNGFASLVPAGKGGKQRGNAAAAGAAAAATAPASHAHIFRNAPGTVLFEPPDERDREIEQRFVGPTGIKLHVRLACALQPANWCVEPPFFVSCLEALTGLHRPPPPDASDDETIGSLRSSTGGRRRGGIRGSNGAVSAAASAGVQWDDLSSSSSSALAQRRPRKPSSSSDAALLSAAAAAVAPLLSSDSRGTVPLLSRSSRSRVVSLSSEATPVASACNTPRGGSFSVAGAHAAAVERSPSRSAALAVTAVVSAAPASSSSSSYHRTASASSLSHPSSSSSGSSSSGRGGVADQRGRRSSVAVDVPAAAATVAAPPPSRSSKRARRSSTRGASTLSGGGLRAAADGRIDAIDDDDECILIDDDSDSGDGDAISVSSEQSIVVDVEIDDSGAMVGASTVYDDFALPAGLAASLKAAAGRSGNGMSSSSSFSSSSDGGLLTVGAAAASSHSAPLSRRSSSSRSRSGSAGASEGHSLHSSAASLYAVGGSASLALSPGLVSAAAAAASAPSSPAAGVAATAAMLADRALLQELHRAALSIDLGSAPARGDSWLSSSLIDAVTFEFARMYPQVHFLPTNVLAFELPNAARASKAGGLLSYSCTDLLGRTVTVRSDAIGPVVAIPTSREVLTRLEAEAAAAAMAAAVDAAAAAVTSSSTANGAQRGSLNASKRPSRPASSSSPSPSVTASSADAPYAPLPPPPPLPPVKRHAPMIVPMAPSAAAVSAGSALPSPASSTGALSTGPLSSGGSSASWLARGWVGRHSAAAPSASSSFDVSPAASSVHGSGPPRQLENGSNSSNSRSSSSGSGSTSGIAPAVTAAAPAPAAPAAPHPYYVCQPPSGYRVPAYASSNRPLLLMWNVGNMHWNLIRVQTGAYKLIEVFEPMGKPGQRLAATPYASDGLSLRSVPRPLIEWLDTVCPLPTEGGWRSRTVSAIKSKQQGNGFDCGVACLLYSEKCAQGREKEDIGLTTDQSEITWFRELVNAYFDKLSGSSAAGAAAATR